MIKLKPQKNNIKFITTTKNKEPDKISTQTQAHRVLQVI